MDYSFLQCGEGALTVHLGDGIDPAINRRVTALQGAIDSAGLRGITDLIPAYADLTVCYDCTVISAKALQRQLRRLLDSLSVAGQDRRRVFRLPVCYGGDYGPDLDFVCHHSGLSAQEVIALHSQPDYLIYMLGFLPGFAYLGGLDPRLHTPRLDSPRTCIPAGSVGIGGAQTGIYPLASPGGWRIIGRTPVRPYDPDRESPILYAAGDYLRFVPITPQEFSLIETQVESGTYECEIVKGRATTPVQAGTAGERSEGCEASERNASERAAVPQVNAVPQANQEEEDEDALWV